MYHIWIIDDSDENIAMIERSFPEAVRPIITLRSFLDERKFLTEFAKLCAKHPEKLPDFVLLDFYLAHMYGDQALAEMLHGCEQAGVSAAQRPVVIGHSSMPAMSELLVLEGADFALAKHPGRSMSVAIQRAFASAEAIAWMREQRKAWK